MLKATRIQVLPRISKRERMPQGNEILYNDLGCEYSPTCLDCPLLVCQYDEPGHKQQIRSDAKDQRNVEIMHMVASGKPTTDIAKFFKLDERTIYRILAKCRAAAETKEEL